MGIIEAIGKGFSQSGKLSKVALIFFAFNLVLGLIMLPFVGTTPEAQPNPASAAVSLAVTILGVIIFVFLQGGALGIIRDLLKRGAFNLADFAANGKKYYLKIMGLLLMIIALALVIVLVLALIAAGVLAVANNAFTRALILAFITVLGVIAAVLFLFPIYTLVVDDAGPVAALKKGIALSRKNFWKTLGLSIVLFIFTFVIAVLIMVLPTLLAGILPVKAGQALMLLVNSVVQSYLSIVIMTALMAFYLSLASAEQSKAPTTV